MEDTEVKKIYLIDIRNVLIILLIGVCIWFFFNPMTNQKIEVLQEDNVNKQQKIDKLTKERDSLKNERINIDLEIEKLQKLSKLRHDTIQMYKRISSYKDSEIRDLKADVNLYNELLDRRKKEIDDLVKNPIILPKNKIVEKSSEKF